MPYKKKLSARKWLFAVSLFIGVYTSLMIFVLANSSYIDYYAFNEIAPCISERNTVAIKAITFLGSSYFLVPANLLLILFFVLRKNKQMALLTGFTGVSSLLLMSLLKRLFQRHRPDDPLVAGITNYSFPSGHSFMSVAFFGLLIWLSALYIQKKLLRNALIFLLALVIFLIGFSRIYLRVHYITDVVAGLTFGTAWLLACLFLMRKQTGIRAYKQT